MKRTVFGSLPISAMLQFMSPKNITDYDLQALIDNELDREDQKNVLDYIECNPDVKKRYKELKAQKEALQRWYKK